jgi:hypothetical protein
MAPAITTVTVRMYQVGFGDAFLLSFGYDAPLADGRDRRHILIDFGSLMDPAYPSLVVRSWTEEPGLDQDARAPGAAVAGGDAVAGEPVGGRSRAFLRQLRQGEQFAHRLFGLLGSAAPTSLAAAVGAVAEGADPIANKPAVDQLEAWSTNGRGRYLHHGMASGIEDVVPGLKVSVLGPPTLDQHEEVAGQARSDDEFWMFYGGLRLDAASLLGVDAAGGDPNEAVPDPGNTSLEGTDHTGRMSPAADAPDTKESYGEPGPVRWLTDRMTRQGLHSLMRIVRILDDVLNNTSLILLFEVPTVDVEPFRMLFPGDAQIENWEYALKFARERDAVLDSLGKVDLYKVGHHGSRNATPRTLYNLWEQPGTKDRPMVALMSTKAHVHGETKATAVPRETLVAALDTRTKEHLYSTQGLLKKLPYVTAMVDATVGSAVTVADGERSRARDPED